MNIYKATKLQDLNENMDLGCDSSESEDSDDIVYNIIPKSDNLIAYNDYTKNMKIIKIQFSSVSSKYFLENSSFLNLNGKLYISGGSDLELS